MSETFYVLVFGHTTDAFLGLIGMDAAFREKNRMSVYTLEAHVSYLREVAEGEPLAVETQLLDLDHKRAHVFHHMRHAGSGDLLATGELMLLNVQSQEDGNPRSAPFPEEVARRLQEIRDAHQGLPHPEQAGRAVGIRR
jgi:acyl-CoA thioester hydrolase